MRKIKTRYALFDAFLYLCALLSGLVPRYILNFKIPIGMGVSMFTVAVMFTWMLFARRIIVYKRIECFLFIVWFLLITGAVWRAGRLGIWASYAVWITTAILFVQILYNKANANSFEIIVRAIVDALFIQLLIGLREIRTHHYYFEVGSTSPRLYGNVAISMFHNLNDYATFVVTILPFAVYLLLTRKAPLLRIYYLFICAASVFLALRSESRGAILGLALIVATVLFLFLCKPGKSRLFGTAVILLPILILLLSPIARESVFSWIEVAMSDRSGNSNQTRINLILNGLYFLRRTYGFGVGAGNLYQWFIEKAIYPIYGVYYMHNWYLEIAVTFGLAFFALYMCFHIKVIISLWKNFRKKREIWTVNNALLISFVAFSLASISSSSNVYSEWVWMYLAFIATFVLRHKKRLLPLRTLMAARRENGS